MKAFVIVHPEWGIYLGSCFGLGFWSKLDPAGQSCAVTFPSPESAGKYMAYWETQPPPPGVTFHPVQPDNGNYATIAACKLAGLDDWENPSGSSPHS